MFDLKKKTEPALATLLSVYERRPDLREVFPEVRSGHYERLITWAANAATDQSKDSSKPELAPYAKWYRANFQVVAAPIPWRIMERTGATSAYPSPITLKVMQDQGAGDISYHLPTLLLLVLEFSLKNIVELGTRTGNSTLTLLEAAQHVGGRVLSIDIDPCLEAKRRVQEANLTYLWTFIQGHDLQLESDRIFQPIHLLLIDTNHLYEYTVQELKKYSSHLRSGSWVVLHDYVSFPGVNRAVEEFVKALPSKPSCYTFVHQNGLALLRMP
jgi:predicted O-methyltransferase YrrM